MESISVNHVLKEYRECKEQYEECCRKQKQYREADKQQVDCHAESDYQNKKKKLEKELSRAVRRKNNKGNVSTENDKYEFIKDDFNKIELDPSVQSYRLDKTKIPDILDRNHITSEKKLNDFADEFLIAHYKPVLIAEHEWISKLISVILSILIFALPVVGALRISYYGFASGWWMFFRVLVAILFVAVGLFLGLIIYMTFSDYEGIKERVDYLLPHETILQSVEMIESKYGKVALDRLVVVSLYADFVEAVYQRKISYLEERLRLLEEEYHKNLDAERKEEQILKEKEEEARRHYDQLKEEKQELVLKMVSLLSGVKERLGTVRLEDTNGVVDDYIYEFPVGEITKDNVLDTGIKEYKHMKKPMMFLYNDWGPDKTVLNHLYEQIKSIMTGFGISNYLPELKFFILDPVKEAMPLASIEGENTFRIIRQKDEHNFYEGIDEFTFEKIAKQGGSWQEVVMEKYKSSKRIDGYELRVVFCVIPPDSDKGYECFSSGFEVLGEKTEYGVLPIVMMPKSLYDDRDENKRKKFHKYDNWFDDARIF